VIEFYRLFNKKTVAQDPHGNVWEKLPDQLCSWEIWQKKKK
jgi:hypothetical protein